MFFYSADAIASAVVSADAFRRCPRRRPRQRVLMRRETPQQRQRQDAFAQRVGKELGLKLSRQIGRVNFRAFSDGKLVSYVVLKCRDVPSKKFTAYQISKEKFDYAYDLAHFAGVPLMLAIEWSDAEGVCPIDKPKESYRITRNAGRTVQTRDEPTDIEDMRNVPIKDFKLFSASASAPPSLSESPSTSPSSSASTSTPSSKSSSLSPSTSPSLSASPSTSPSARCSLCPRWKEAEHVRIDGRTYDKMPGTKPSILILVPEVGPTEDRENEPVSGWSQGFVKSVLRTAGIDPEDTFITASIRCAAEKKPGVVALRACRTHLEADLSKIKPKLVVSMGSVACKLLAVPGGMTARGSIVRYVSGGRTIPVVPTHAPLAVKRDEALREQVIEDLRRAKRIASGELEAFGTKSLEALNLSLVTTVSDLDAALDTMFHQPYVAIDSETRGHDPYVDPETYLVLLQLSWSEKDAIAIPIHHPERNALLPLDVVQERLHRFLWDYRGQIICHNAKFDVAALHTLTKRPFKIGFDTMLVNALLSGASKSNSLKQMTWAYEIALGGYDEEAAELLKAVDYDSSQVPLAALAQYGMLDTIATYRIAALMREKLAKRKRAARLNTLLTDLSNVLVRAEITGIRIDWEFLEQYATALNTRRAEVETEVREMAGTALPLTEKDLAVKDKPTPFNFASTRHIAHLLYERMGLPAMLQTPGGKDSVSKAALGLLDHPLAEKILELSRINQNLKMYVRAYPKFRRGDHVHPNYHVVRQSDVMGAWGTVSGRTSVSGPNIQQLPREGKGGDVDVGEEGEKGEVRKLILPDDDRSVIADLDFMGIELRVAAMYCQDPLMKSFFNTDSKGDYHLFVASEVFEKAKEKITKEERSLAKNVNFALLYGAGPNKIAGMTKRPVEEVEDYIGRYFERFPGLRKWRSEVYNKVLEHHFAVSMFGRKRMLPEAKSKTDEDRGYAQRTGLNHLCQSAAADICFDAIVRTHRLLKEKKSKIRMMMTIHDSIVFSVPLTEVNFVEKIRREMENCQMPEVVKRGVKIGVDAKIGVNYGSLVPLEEALAELK